MRVFAAADPWYDISSPVWFTSQETVFHLLASSLLLYYFHVSSQRAGKTTTPDPSVHPDKMIEEVIYNVLKISLFLAILIPSLYLGHTFLLWLPHMPYIFSRETADEAVIEAGQRFLVTKDDMKYLKCDIQAQLDSAREDEEFTQDLKTVQNVQNVQNQQLAQVSAGLEETKQRLLALEEGTRIQAEREKIFEKHLGQFEDPQMRHDGRVMPMNANIYGEVGFHIPN